MNIGINIGLGSAAMMGRGPTPARIGAMSGVTSWAHWPLHPALNRSLATVVASAPLDLEAWTTQVGVTHSAGRMMGDGNTSQHYAQVTALPAKGPARIRLRLRSYGSHQWVVVTVGNVRAAYDVINGVVGNTYGSPVSATITNVGDGWWQVEIIGNASDATYNWMTLNDSNSTTSGSFSLASSAGVEYAAVSGDACYFSSTHAQQVSDEGPRAAHLVMATPDGMPDLNDWDASGSQGGIAGARHPSGRARYMDAVDAVLGAAVNSTTHYVVTWSINSWTPGASTSRILSWSNADGSSVDEVLRSAGVSARTRNRTGSAAADYSGTGSGALQSRVVVVNGAASDYYENGTLIGSATVVTPLSVAADRMRLFGSATTFEGLFLGGGVFVFDSAAAMTAALPSIHAMVAYMRALWGL